MFSQGNTYSSAYLGYSVTDLRRCFDNYKDRIDDIPE